MSTKNIVCMVDIDDSSFLTLSRMELDSKLDNDTKKKLN